MTNKTEIDKLVDRYHAGTVYTVDEFITVLNALLPYADEGSQFKTDAEQNLLWASQLDPNEVAVRLDEEDNVTYPVVTAGIGVGIVE